MNENTQFGIYKLFENYVETYEHERCIPEEMFEGLILDIVEYIETKQ